MQLIDCKKIFVFIVDLIIYLNVIIITFDIILQEKLSRIIQELKF